MPHSGTTDLIDSVDRLELLHLLPQRAWIQAALRNALIENLTHVMRLRLQGGIPVGGPALAGHAMQSVSCSCGLSFKVRLQRPRNRAVGRHSPNQEVPGRHALRIDGARLESRAGKVP